MFESDLTTLVKSHYGEENSQLLLLSDLGILLTEKGIQQEPGDRRSLRETVEQITELNLVRDPEASAFIAVVLQGDEKRAEDVIVERRRRHFLRILPRPILLAFTLDIAEGHTMSVQLSPKVVYQGGPIVSEGWIVVDSDLRLPGVDAHDIDSLDAGISQELETRIRSWCDRHHIEPASLVRSRSRRVKADLADVTTDSTKSRQARRASALERLLEAQEPEVARRLNLPIDIALFLSRMP